MSMLLFVVGGLSFAAGAICIAFGFWIDLSFGNSLIVAGTFAAVGGLIVIGLGAVVAQLQRIGEGMAGAPPVEPTRASDMFEPPAVPPRTPFPSRPRVDAGVPPEHAQESTAFMPAALPVGVPDEEHFAAPPALANPDMPPVEVHEEVSLSLSEPMVPPPLDMEKPVRPRSPPVPPPRVASAPLIPPVPPPDFVTRKPPPLPEAGRTPLGGSYDSIWPSRDARPAPEAGKTDNDRVTKAAEPSSPQPASSEVRAVAILKSGVVDGMGYTLYVDGSIEAELPQGTLRFTSINDLRDYLEKNSHS